MSQPAAVHVVAAMIKKGGHILICQRPAHKARALLWEFPGGKVDPGETPEAALIRECREELAVDIQVGSLYMQVTHAYPDLTVRLSLYWAGLTAGEPQALEHEAIRWASPGEFPSYAFCPADADILQRIAKELAVGTFFPQSEQ